MKKLLLFALLLLCFSCGKKTQAILGDGILNSSEAREAPYVILISLDGYRWDYTERFQPPNISQFIADGVQAESLIPCYPSKTFPNHYSIATGMYPENHGLVDNSFFSPSKNAEYRIRDREKVQDGTWYGGTPLWVQSTKSGMVSASFFFVGSEADVQGIRPNYYRFYDGSITNEARVEQVLDWLELPTTKRPHFIAMYFSDMDDVGHAYGPYNQPELSQKLMKLDHVLGKLFNGVKKTGLPVNIVIVSDHGMAEVPVNQLIANESIENDELYRTVSNGAIVHIYVNDGVDVQTVFDYLKSKENHFSVHRTSEAPHFDIPAKNPNWGDIQVIPDLGWYFSSARSIGFRKSSGKKVVGEHGYPTSEKELHGILYANGPAFKNGLVTPSVKNIHVYPVICEILGLDVPDEVDGKLSEWKEALK